MLNWSWNSGFCEAGYRSGYSVYCRRSGFLSGCRSSFEVQGCEGMTLKNMPGCRPELKIYISDSGGGRPGWRFDRGASWGRGNCWGRRNIPVPMYTLSFVRGFFSAGNQGIRRIGYLRMLKGTGKTPTVNIVFSFFPTRTCIFEKTNGIIKQLLNINFTAEVAEVLQGTRKGH